MCTVIKNAFSAGLEPNPPPEDANNHPILAMRNGTLQGISSLDELAWVDW